MNTAITGETQIIALESAYTSGVYPKRPLALVRGRGARVWDSQGREYIDCVGGQGAAILGHAHPILIEAITRQASQLISCPEIFYNDRRAELLARLAAVAPAGLERVFLCNSGAEAVETAIKFARLSTGRPKIIAAMRGFHGRTLGALSATWKPEYREGCAPLVPGFCHVPYNDVASLEANLDLDTAAVLLEVIQGEGGVHPASPGYLATAAELCRKAGALLIFDEVQTGFGRTGRLFACEHYGVTPDLIAVAKGMAGGVPMGACLIGPRVGPLRLLSHGSTFGGNPLACAASLATLEALTSEYPSPGSGETLIARSLRLGTMLLQHLRAIPSPLIREVRGLGLMVGVELRTKVTPILQRLQDLGVLALPAGGTVLRLLPPLVVEEADLERVVVAIGIALDQTAAESQAHLNRPKTLLFRQA